jgi:hypothetical protein
LGARRRDERKFTMIQCPDPLCLVGANLPWFQYGCDFGANAWQPEGGVAHPDRRQRTDRALARLADSGLSIERVVAPILAGCANDPAIAAWDIVNEPEWVTLGRGTANPLVGVLPSAMRDFVGRCAACVHQHTSHPATAGLASSRSVPEILETARAAGYSAALGWSAEAGDRRSEGGALLTATREWGSRE